MKILIDGDVCLYLALARNEEATLEDGIRHFDGIIIDTMEAHFAKPEDVEIYLSSDGQNFRKNHYPDRYKFNRQSKTPPPFLAELKDHVFRNEPRSVGSPGGEADDFLIMRAVELDYLGEPWSIATVDKDLMTYPGMFYNLRTQVHKQVTEDEAYTFMLQQFLMGDPVDTIPGLRGWGKKKTEKVIHVGNTIKENYYALKETWEQEYGEGWQEEANYTYNCAFIRRYERDLKPLDMARGTYAEFIQSLGLRV